MDLQDSDVRDLIASGISEKVEIMLKFDQVSCDIPRLVLLPVEEFLVDSLRMHNVRTRRLPIS